MKIKWIVSLWMLTIFIIVSPLHNALANSSQSEKIEYTKSQLTPTLEQGAKKNPPPPPPPSKNGGDGDEGFFDKAKRFGKKIISGTVDGFKGATKFVKEAASDIMDSASEYWDDRSLFKKSLIIIGTIATVVTLGAAAGVISAGAAVTMGAMGALNYGLYAATADNVTFGGGLLWGGIGMGGGALGLAVKGAKFLAPARALFSRATIPALGRLGTFIPAAATGAVLSSGTAVYTHLAKWAITGEPPNWGEVGRDALVWGAAGAVGGGAFSSVTKAASKYMSKGKSMVAGGLSAGGSETAVSDWLQGNKISLKKVAIGATAGAVLTGALIALPQIGNKTVKQAAHKTEIAATNSQTVAKTETTVNEAGEKAAIGTISQSSQPVIPTTTPGAADPYHQLKQNGIPQTFTDGEIGLLRAADMRMELQAPVKTSTTIVPTVKSGEFNNWYNSLSTEQLETLWKDKRTRKAIERQLRSPGGMHEWHLVSRAPTFKRWGVTSNQIRDLRTAIDEVEFVNPTGKHGGLGSTKAHNELLEIIDTSDDYNTFVRRLNNWSNYRLKGGTGSLPEDLWFRK
jgi:hypothetical protein